MCFVDGLSLRGLQRSPLKLAADDMSLGAPVERPKVGILCGGIVMTVQFRLFIPIHRILSNLTIYLHLLRPFSLCF